jgi:hypothetical protein
MCRVSQEEIKILYFLGCFRVDRPVTKQQGRLDPRGGLGCFWCPNKTGASLVDASNTLAIVENRLEMRKIWPSRIVKGVKNSRKQTIKHYKDWFPNVQKISCMFLCYY